MAQRSGRPRKKSEEPRYNIRAVERALAVLGSFSIESPELSLKEVTDRTGLAKPTVFRLLATLESHRFIIFDATAGRYRLGSKMLEVGGIAFSSLGLRKVARPHLNRLQSETGATVLLGTLMDDQLVYIDKRESAGPIRIASDIGWRRSPHFGMLGMALMAFQEPTEVQRLLVKTPLAPHTRFSLTDEVQFLRRLEEIRRDGHVFELNEAIEGVWGVAAPIWGYDEQVVAAVGASLPAVEMTQDRVAQTVASVTECAREISVGMGHKRKT
jgi:DNA-binding IclR family transcriptional regulator